VRADGCALARFVLPIVHAGRRMVTSRKQAIAIGLSEARKAGAKVPKRRRRKKRSSKKRRSS
jgi:hypothetical protein